MSKKRKAIKPDDYFSVGPIQVARFGENICMQADWAGNEFEEFQVKLIERFPYVVLEIDNLISQIVELVEILPPEKLLQRAWGEMAVLHLNKAAEVDVDSDDIASIRMIDYLQSVICAINPNTQPKSEVSEDDWVSLRTLVEKLFNQLNHEYQICRTAVKRKEDPLFDQGVEEYYYKAQLYWCNIRGHRYLYHEEAYFLDLVSPHSEILHELFDITAEQFVKELMKIQRSLTSGMGEAAVEIKEFQRITTDALMLRLNEEEEVGRQDIKELMAEIIQENGWNEWKDSVIGRFLGLDLFDLQKVTNIPVQLLEHLSWSPGQDVDFFADGEFNGWPLRIWPIFKRPFVKLCGRYYCFDLYNLLDNLYRVLQKTVTRLKVDYRAEWNRKQMEVTESLPFEYLQKLLPGAQEYHSIYYKWHTGDGGNKQWCEVDGLLIYDDHLFVIEVKAGAFTYTSPANDFPAYIESIKNLVLKPSIQGKRFVKYLNSATSVDIFDENHCRVGDMTCADFRKIIICPISLDGFTELAAQVQHLKVLGVDVGNSPIWAISIDDLRAYADIFDNPLTYLHFLEQRMRAFSTDIIQAEDELDHVGLYIKHNIYTQHAKEMLSNGEAKLNFIGYRSDIDKFFAEKLLDSSTLSPLKQEMPERLIEIIDILSLQSRAGRSEIASYLLDCCGSWRDTITGNIEEVLAKQKKLKKPFPLSTHGDIKLTIFCWQRNTLPRNEFLAFDHTRATMLITGDTERILLELFYSEKGTLESVDWTKISLNNISSTDIKRLSSVAADLKEKRLNNAGKVGRNSQCPCGSGLKYKKCCLQ